MKQPSLLFKPYFAVLKTLRPMAFWAIALGILFIPAFLQAQNFVGESVSVSPPQLQKQFTAYEVYRLDAAALHAHAQSGTTANLQLGDLHWQLDLQPSRIYADNYFLQAETARGRQTLPGRKAAAFKGHELNGGGRVRLTLHEQLVYGYVQGADECYYVEPLWYFDRTAARDLFVVYKKSDVIRSNETLCGVTETAEELERLEHSEPAHHDEAEFMACYELQIAIASDHLMLNKYGSESEVEAHNVGVINNVQGDYTGNFNHDLEFIIVTQFVSDQTNTWDATLDAGDLLDDFTDWGNAGNFGVTFDVGELWTNRNFAGSTIGIAFLNGICNSVKYHCLQDFSNDADLLRCLTSHELGHNFSSNHDACSTGTFIMCPFVSTSTTWSTGSTNAINNYMQTRINNGCLSPCASSPPVVSAFEASPNPACVGETVFFTNQSTGPVTSRTWSFPGGTPATSTQINPTVTWATPGVKNVTLTVNGPGGNNSSSQTITVLPLPVANFTSSVSGLTVNFNNTSTNATSFEWNFGDGGGSNEENPSYTYTEAGTYVVTLIVSNDCGTATRILTINTAPTADFEAEATEGCAPFVASFQNRSSANAVTLQWQFPGGVPSTSTQQNPTVTYTLPGTYSVTLTATNTQGNSVKVRTSYITVSNAPTANFTNSINGLAATFNNTSSNADTYLWNFGDGETSDEANPTHTYAAGGVYTIALTATNECGSVTINRTINVTAAPTANFTTNSSTGCSPLTVQFTNTSTGNANSINWQFPGGNPSTSTAANPTVVYNTAGIYTVTLTVGNGSGTTSASQTINANASPTAGFGASVSGATATFSNNSSNATSYSWNFGDSQISTSANPTHTYAADGTYTVTLTATNACGSSTSTQTVVIVTPPTAGFSASNATGCGPLSVQFNSNSSANSATFEWQFPGGTPSTSSAQNPLVVYSLPGTYSVTLTVGNAAGSNTSTQTSIVTVNPSPTAGFGASVSGATATFSNNSSNATSYSWNFGDSQTSTSANPTHTYAADGTYTVTLTATNACGSSTSTQTVVIVTPPTAGFSASNATGCGPLSVQFNSNSSANSATFEWQFPGGTPSTSSAQNPLVVYSLPGTYSVTLTVGNAAGSNTSTQTSIVTVNPSPTAGFGASVSGATATFSNNSSNATSYSWNFGDSQTSTSANPTHTYAADGTYTVTLTATNACGSNTSTQTVVIATSPSAGFTANTTTGCIGLSVQFSDISSANTTAWAWTFPGGTPATSAAQNPTVTYLTPGIYDVTLLATSAGGSSTFTQTNLINVLSNPTANFGASVSGANATFSNSSTNATSYTWNFGDDSNSTEANPAHTYAADGIYTVTLNAINNCGTAIFEQQITITTPPSAAFGPMNLVGCAPFEVQFANQSSANSATYAWVFEGGEPATSAQANPTVVWNQAGVYTVTLTAFNAAGNSTSTATVTVNSVPTPTFTSQTAGLSVVLTNNSANADSYTWDFGDSNTSTEANPTHTYAATGTYLVTLNATNECGTRSVTETIIISGDAPLPAIIATNTQGCAPLSVAFADQSEGAPTAWAWTFPGGNPGTSTEQNPNVTYSASGVYDVTLAVTNIFGTTTATFPTQIEVLDFPTAAFEYTLNQGTVTVSNASQNATSYAWNFGDGSTSTEAAPTHTYAASGTYTIEMTASNACGASTLQKTVVVVLVGAEEPEWLRHFSLFPNPNAGVFTLTMEGAAQDELVFTLFNAVGQMLRYETVDFRSGTLTHTFEWRDLPSAMYTLQVQAAGRTWYLKVAVQR
jgi:PKD repeat protein